MPLFSMTYIGGFLVFWCLFVLWCLVLGGVLGSSGDGDEGSEDDELEKRNNSIM